MNSIQKDRINRARQEVHKILVAFDVTGIHLKRIRNSDSFTFAPSNECPSGRVTFGELVQRRITKTAMG